MKPTFSRLSILAGDFHRLNNLITRLRIDPSLPKYQQFTLLLDWIERHLNRPNPDIKVHRAIDQIIEFNNHPTRSHSDKWAIGISILKRLTKTSQTVIRRVLKQRQEELNQHHRFHQLDVSHNHCHRHKHKITDLIKL